MKLLLVFVVSCCLFLTVSGFKPTSVGQVSELSGNSTGCTICQFIVNIAEGFVENNVTEQEIIQELEFSCNLLGVPAWVTECQGLIATFGPLIIQYIINNETPYVICNQIGFCNSTEILYQPISFPKKMAQYSNFESDQLNCILCEWAIAKIEEVLTETTTQNEILSYLEQQCLLLGNNKWIYDCKTLIADYGAIVIDTLVNNNPPNKVCASLLGCSSSSINTPLSNSQIVVN